VYPRKSNSLSAHLADFVCSFLVDVELQAAHIFAQSLQRLFGLCLRTRITRSIAYVTMRLPRLRSSPTIFHPNTNRRMYRSPHGGWVSLAGFRPACPELLSCARLPSHRSSVSFLSSKSEGLPPILIKCTRAYQQSGALKNRLHCSPWDAPEVFREVGVNDFLDGPRNPALPPRTTAFWRFRPGR